MEIITRAEAKERGLKRYFTGKPCKHGHIAERTSREGKCTKCMAIMQSNNYIKNREKRLKQNAKYREENKEKLYAHKKEYYKENKEKVLKKNKEYRVANKDKIIHINREYYKNNKTEILNKNKEYYNRNIEHAKELSKKYRVENKEKLIEYRKNNKEYYKDKSNKYYKENKKDISEKIKVYRANNIEKIREREKGYREKYKDKIIAYRKTEKCRLQKVNCSHKRRTLKKQGDVTTQQLITLQETQTHCYWCGTPLKGKKSHIDHYIPLSKGGKHTISNLVMSCASCNLSKGAKMPEEFAMQVGRLL